MSQRSASARWRRGAVAVATAVGMMAGGLAPAADPGAAKIRRVALQDEPAPTLDGIDLGTEWINTGGPIRARDLRGKVVLLDFWTSCCINCHHVLPDLAMLEEKYKNELVVIGVHTPKFPAERDLENLRSKVREYRIRHPVVNDANQAIWEHYGVNSWPTLMLFDANGNYLDRMAGEIGTRLPRLEKYLEARIAHHRSRGELNETPLQFFPEAERPHAGPLNAPGKVLADPQGKRLFISDTGNNRIVVADLGGKVLKTIGNGAAGFADGSYDKATFNRQQGVCLHGGTLYVADTENHAIRAVDLKDERVRTVAGTGKQGHGHRGEGPALKTALNSPWDVLNPPDSKELYIAMAGPHQIWRLDLESSKVGPWAGTGEESIRNGSLESAQFAQPSGLATDGKHLFVADSETSSVREITYLPVNNGLRVQTIVGQGLFVWGDVDGQGPAVRLQHDLGLAYGHNKRLYIADTYNNKIKVCDPEARAVTALVGSKNGEAGASDSPPLFNQPGGLSLAGSTLYVADTNNHAIRTVDLSATPPKVATFALEGLTAPAAPAPEPKFVNRTAIDVPAAKVAPGGRVVLDVRLNLPAGLHLNAETPMPYLVAATKHADLLAPPAAPGRTQISPPAPAFEVAVPLAREAQAGQTIELKLSLSTFQCKEGADGFCLIKSYIWKIPVTFTDGAPERIKLTNPGATAAAE